MTTPLTVVGIGNVFLGDDGFGPAVVDALQQRSLPGWLTVHDYGIRLLHLGFDLPRMDPDLVVVDAHDSGAPPGTLTVLELDAADLPDGGVGAHAAGLGSALRQALAAGWAPQRLLLLGCQPASTAESMTLSPPVAVAVPHAVQAVLDRRMLR